MHWPRTCTISPLYTNPLEYRDQLALYGVAAGAIISVCYYYVAGLGSGRISVLFSDARQYVLKAYHLGLL